MQYRKKYPHSFFWNQKRPTSSEHSVSHTIFHKKRQVNNHFLHTQQEVVNSRVILMQLIPSMQSEYNQRVITGFSEVFFFVVQFRSDHEIDSFLVLLRYDVPVQSGFLIKYRILIWKHQKCRWNFEQNAFFSSWSEITLGTINTLTFTIFKRDPINALKRRIYAC